MTDFKWRLLDKSADFVEIGWTVSVYNGEGRTYRADITVKFYDGQGFEVEADFADESIPPLSTQVVNGTKKLKADKGSLIETASVFINVH
jgi:hypothetical protein